MGGVVKFEELNIWQEARRIVKEIYQNTASIKDMGFNEQIQTTENRMNDQSMRG